MMKCPYCLNDLVRTKNKCYQTLSEHVSHPNYYVPPRPAYKCSDGCTDGSFFDPYGARYGDIKSGDPLGAVNSIEWRIENWDRWDWWTLTREMKIFGQFLTTVEVN